MNLITEDLELIALDIDKQYINNKRFKLYLGKAKDITISKSIIEAVGLQIRKIRNSSDPEQLLEVWILVRKSDRIVVGSVCMIEPIKEQLDVRIDYFLEKSYEGLGYITQAIKEVYLFVLKQTDILPTILIADQSDGNVRITQIID